MTNETQSIAKQDPVAQCIFNYKEEAETARRNREILNRENFECYHLRQDYSHKRRGQSKEFLAKQSIGTEQLCSFLQQGLMDLGDWYRIEPEDGLTPDDLKIKPKEMELLLLGQLDKNKFPNFFNDALKFGILGSLMIVKVGGKYRMKSEFEARSDSQDLAGKKRELYRKDKKFWELNYSLVRQEDFFPDATGSGLYELERIEMDHHELVKIAKDYPEDFDLDAVMQMTAQTDDLQKNKKARETGQNPTYSQYRKRVTFYECWGTLLKQDSGEVIMENCVSACDLQGNVIRPPKKNPWWHNSSPYVTSPIIRVPRSVWHKALMDAGTRHNIAQNELYNLIVDAAMMEVHGIKQMHSSWLEDPTQVSDGIPPGTTLLVNSQCPPGMKVLERVDTSAVTSEAINIFNIIDKEFQQSSLSNDSRMGNLSQRAVKATEVVAANQSLSGILNGIVKVIEGEFTAPLLEKSWMTCAQHLSEMNPKEIEAKVGVDRGKVIAGMTSEEVFAETAGKHAFKVFGLSMTLNKIQDFRKITTLLQSIGQSPQMMQEFSRKYSMTKLLGEVVKSLDIDEAKIIADKAEQDVKAEEKKQMLNAVAQGEQAGENPTAGGEGSNPQSQIPQISANSTQDGGISIPRGMNNQGMTTPA